MIVLLLGVAAMVLVVVGIWSASLAMDSSVAETKLDLTANTPEPGAGRCSEPLWVDPEDLIGHEPPSYFARGPGRQISMIDRIFKPRVVYREVAPPVTNGSPNCPWGYVVSDSPLPFFVRTTYGVFPGGGRFDDDGVPVGSVEGVRTYFSVLGKKIYLNEWRVSSSAPSSSPVTEGSP